MVNKCPCCGSIVTRPILFALCPQRIFNYIWDHPECTKIEIEKAVYGKKLESNIVHVHVSRIRNRLRDTSFRLINNKKKYSIVDVTIPSTTPKESVNASI